MRSFFEQEAGLTVGDRELCVCGACNVSISQALKAKNKCETYQFRWLKNKRVCCVPSCGSSRGVARGVQRGQMPPLFSRKCDTCSLYYDQFIAKQITSYFSQRDLLSI